jgi:hypothetical protein
LKSLALGVRKLFVVGGWAPLLVFLAHVVGDRVIDVYSVWPDADVPMHFAGGLSFAFFASGCIRALTAGAPKSSRLVVLELVLAGSLTATAAVLWEFAEFALDHTVGTTLQVSLANTMQDMALGLLGAVAFLVVRARRLRAGAELRAVANEWLAGRAA